MKQIRTLMMLGACLFALAAFAQQNPPANDTDHSHMGNHQMPSVDDHMKQLTARLNLTADQQAKVRPILEESLPQMQSLMKDESLSKEDRHAKMQAIHESMKAKMAEILNDDQKKKLAAMMSEHEQGAKGGHDHSDHK
ncbi:MAG TPA: hypothetical protein VFT65_19605 [Candidatus Angelobacter sp.]|nr:hypothetical protein [Candidatus Angelobacter sp.]